MSRSIIKKQQQTGLIAVRTIQNFGIVLAESKRDSYEAKVKCLSIEEDAKKGKGDTNKLRRAWNKSNNFSLAAKRESSLLILDGITTLSRYKKDVKAQSTMLGNLEEFWNINELAKEALYGEKGRIINLGQALIASEIYGNDEYKNSLNLLIVDVSEWFNVNKNITFAQIEKTSVELMRRFKHLNMLDIALAMKDIKNKSLPEDNVFDRVEPAHFIKAAEWYDKKKTEEIVELQSRRHEKHQGDNNYNAIINEHKQYEHKKIREKLKGWEDKISNQKRGGKNNN